MLRTVSMPTYKSRQETFSAGVIREQQRLDSSRRAGGRSCTAMKANQPQRKKVQVSPLWGVRVVITASLLHSLQMSNRRPRHPPNIPSSTRIAELVFAMDIAALF
mmetsp:Transcript_51754/g.138114  ORF Transcript_51754/g.138114 Transcript_51754/m.138114 type:complete len:105 (-) Transcript_51754:570-884(-)